MEDWKSQFNELFFQHLQVFFTATFGTYALKRAAPHLEYVQTAAAVASNIFGIIERVRI